MSRSLGKPFLLYIMAMDSSLGTLLTHHNEEGNDHALYYLSQTMVGVELNYSTI